jgi:hypothetical protein
MSCYVASNNNRFYAALEAAYGSVPAITGANRIPAVKLAAAQAPEQTGRRDKTGSRTFVGVPNTVRKRTAFRLDTFLTEWPVQASGPAHAALFQAAMGGAPMVFGGGTVASSSGTTGITFSAPHGLNVGQGITLGGEIRFVAAVQDATTVFVNAPFANGVTAGATIGRTVTFPLGTALAGVSVFDYWDPSTAVQRIVSGGAVDVMRVRVNGDYQEFSFAGPARDLLDSASFAAGQGGLTEFPAEPVDAGFDYTVVPGHLGQVWMGPAQTQVLTLTAAELTLRNGVELRTREFGSDYARCITAGERSVNLRFSLFEDADAAQGPDGSAALYQAARQRSPIGVMLQLGEQAGQLFGAYMPAVVPEVPEFDDRETRLQWMFESRAQGVNNDELFIAFG